MDDGGAKNKKTVFVGGVAEDLDEAAIYEQFSTFGDIIEVQLPSAPANQHHAAQTDATKHRGFAFVTYASAADAQDAIDNMDMNELNGRVIKVNLARPNKGLAQQPGGGNRAIWESEEWIQAQSQNGGRNASSNQEDDGEAQDMEE
ncbi:RRM domain-containing protein [Mycena chlorophos]|uniref:Uncharacterized protein n=2 Tax=Mycena chlorophos TaxID=658473 RepID=A0ABQ0M6H6_MYCCL|nr:RRM domain-containing protein [Mycena chlorophos]GAT58659.1 predicted protein [Mycena chlorophos]